jgi:hypothetical protein
MLALLKSVRSSIQTLLGGVDKTVCDVTPDGRPSPIAGQIFYGIVGNDFFNDPGDRGKHCLDEKYTIRVIITLRSDYAPYDRMGDAIILGDPELNAGNPVANTGGLWYRAEQLRAALQMNYTLMDAANTLINLSVANGFIVPLVFRSCVYLGVKGPDWFDAEGEGDPPSGIAVELTFNDAERVQTLESMT